MRGGAFACQPASARSDPPADVLAVAEKDKARQERLASALRENLKRRKAQTRQRPADEETPDQR